MALRFAAEGARVAITARTEAELNSAVEEIAASGGIAIARIADLLDPEVPRRLVEWVRQEFGSLDILVNNAGIGSSANLKPVVEFDDQFWDMTIALNLTVPYRLSKAVLPRMLERKWGRIINISSVIGKMGAVKGAAYAASKHGLIGLTRTLALEVARDGITVNAICPGPVRTVMSDRRVRHDAERMGISFEELESRLTPIGRRLDPAEISPLAVLLASEESAAITGQAYNVCGGYLMS